MHCGGVDQLLVSFNCVQEEVVKATLLDCGSPRRLQGTANSAGLYALSATPDVLVSFENGYKDLFCCFGPFSSGSWVGVFP